MIEKALSGNFIILKSITLILPALPPKIFEKIPI